MWVVHSWKWVNVGSKPTCQKTKNKNSLVTSNLTEPMTQVDYFQRKLDDKRRLTIPTELRERFSGGAVITRGFGNYLHLYPKDFWDQVVEPRLEGDVLDERTADLNVQFRMGKVEQGLDDKQGRITLEQHLLDYAGIDRDVSAVSVGNKYWRIMAADMD
jgi:MraZ protein